jgi:hypothetical protein
MHMQQQQQKVTVAVRVRPILQSGGSAMHQQEKFQLLAVRRVGDATAVVEEQKPGAMCRSSQFTFDHVLDSDSTQLEVYDEAVVDLIDGALLGNNATVLAYGQTGSGKTHTILGDVKPNPLEDDLLTPQSGVFLRVLSDLLEYRQRRKKDLHVVIGLSCIEVYNENIRDLFGGKPGDAPPPLKVTMTEEFVLMPGLITKEVSSMQSVFAEIQLAIKRRQSRATESNSASSRSHCLFLIDVFQQAATAPASTVEAISQQALKAAMAAASGGPSPSGTRTSTPTQPNPPAGSPTASGAADILAGHAGTTIRMPGIPEVIKSSRILIADLAGSEKTGKSGVTGEGFAEATSINSSLTALGNVVHALYEGSSHVSYRNSNLTRLLKPSFSQKSSRVLLLAQVAPTQLTFDESVSTLHFANKVKQIKVSTTMAEGDSDITDFLETVKQHDALLADLHIWSAEADGAQPQMSRGGRSRLNNAAQGQAGRAAFRCLPMPLPAKAEAVQGLDACGAIAAADRHRKEIAAARQRELAEWEQQVPLNARKLHEKYRAEMEIARRNARESRHMHLRNLDEDYEAFYVQITDEAAALFAELFSYEAKERLALQRRVAAHVTAQVTAIRAVEVPKRPGGDQGGTALHADPALLEQAAAEDAEYATTVWAHCNARRFLNSFLEMRDTQYALQVSVGNVLTLETWIAKQQKKKR